MKIVFYTLGLFFSSVVCGQVISFSDANFKSALLEVEGLDVNKDNEISQTEAATIQKLKLSNNNIAQVPEIGFFTALEELDLSNNQLSQIDLDGLDQLGMLNLNNNQISDIQFGSVNSLVMIQANLNALSQLDVSSQLDLVYLDVSDNNLSTLNLSMNSKLSFLNADRNPLPSLDLNNQPDLMVLTVGNTALDDAFLAGNFNPIAFAANNVNFSNVTLSNQPALQYLNLSGTGVGTIDLSNNPNLELIDLSGNESLNQLQTFCSQDSLGLRVLYVNDTSVSEAFIPNTSASVLPDYFFKKDADAIWRDCQTLGIQGPLENEDIMLYPNPADEFIDLSNGEAELIEIFDLNGRLVHSAEAFPIDIKQLATGAYLIKVRMKGNRETKTFKLLKK